MDGLRIVSDGTPEGTHIYLDDEEVHDVTNVTWNFSPRQRKTFITLEVSNVKIDASSTVSQETRDALRGMIDGSGERS